MGTTKKLRKLLKQNANNRQKVTTARSKELELEATTSIIRLLQKLRKIRKQKTHVK